MNLINQRRLNTLASIGLACGAVFGLAGTIVSQPNVQNTLWAIDSVGLIMAAALLTLKFLRKGDDCMAAGFLVFAIGESIILSGTAAGLAGSVPSFAAGTALWATALVLINFSDEFASWTRLAGITSSILFAITATTIFWGERILPISTPLPFFAYPVLVITFIGWIWALVKENRSMKQE